MLLRSQNASDLAERSQNIGIIQVLGRSRLAITFLIAFHIAQERYYGQRVFLRLYSQSLYQPDLHHHFSFSGVYALLWVDKKLLKSVDIEDEMKKGNIAVSIFASTILIFVAVIVAFGFRS